MQVSQQHISRVSGSMPRVKNTHYEPTSGVSFISLVANTEDAFYRTVSFYTDFGFSESAVYDRKLAGTSKLDHCSSSEKETWLYSQGESEGDGTDVCIKVRLVVNAQQWKDGKGAGAPPQAGLPEDPEQAKSFDWRGTSQSVVMYTPKISRIVELLVGKGIAHQLQPSEEEPVEAYCHDPLGTLVGFTTKHNPFTTKQLPLQTGGLQAGGLQSGYGTPMRAPTPAQSDDGKKKRKIAVMTSGGDAPGMNGAVRAVVRMAISKGCEPYAIFEGYAGLVNGGDLIKKMNWEDVRGWLSEGGTLIGTARCKEFRERPGRLSAAKNLIIHGIDAIIICGGDGSLTGADIFRSEWPGLLEELVQTKELTKEQIAPFTTLNVVGMVGSIDNDMTGTDATIGCYSSLSRICQAVDFIDATAYSHSRAFVVEVMGRHCGWLALMAGVSTGADFVFLPEKPPAEGWENEMCGIIAKVRFRVRFGWKPFS